MKRRTYVNNRVSRGQVAYLFDCPSCKRPVLTPTEHRKGHQCGDCTRRDAIGYGTEDNYSQY